METKFIVQPFDRVEADAIAIVLFEEEPAPPELKSASAWLDELRRSGEFTGKPGESAVAYLPQGLAAKRLVIVGGGKREKFDSAALRRAVGSTVRWLKQKGVKKLAWWLASGSAADAAVEGAIVANWETDRYKPSSEAKPLESFQLAAATGDAGLQAAVERGRIIADAQNFTRDLANE